MYDYLIVGAGLFGAVFAHEAVAQGKTCSVIDKRPYITGNVALTPSDGHKDKSEKQKERKRWE
ncbi:MAG: NAD(P)-binding protein [Treponema sp.]|jgi:UDP-galactopyranose mutase|nr:NAD(P)-binding protein [Treponema sp.]